MDRICVVCGFLFRTESSRVSICSDECHKKHARDYNRIWYSNHRDSRAGTMRKYRENGGRNRERLRNLSGYRLTDGLYKRPFPNYCELCGRTYVDNKHKYHYHHWRDESPSVGIWICVKCHWMIEAVDTGLLQKYEKLKLSIEKECVLMALEHLVLEGVLNG